MAYDSYLGENILQFFMKVCASELKDTSSENKFKASLVAMQSNQNPTPGNEQKVFNFGAPYNRAAYMYKFQPCITWITYNYLQRAMVECPEIKTTVAKLLNNSNLKLCCIGGGAGAELIGFLLMITNYTGKATFKALTVIPETAEWRSTINNCFASLQSGALHPLHRHILEDWSKYSTVLGWNFSKPPSSKIAGIMKEANVFLINKVFPASASGDEVEATLKNIISEMKPGALVFYIDYSAGFNVMLRMAHCTNQQIVFGPLREQYKLPQLPEVFKTTYQCYPQISSRMYFIAWRKMSNNLNAVYDFSVPSSPSQINVKDESKTASSVFPSEIFANSSASVVYEKTRQHQLNDLVGHQVSLSASGDLTGMYASQCARLKKKSEHNLSAGTNTLGAVSDQTRCCKQEVDSVCGGDSVSSLVCGKKLKSQTKALVATKDDPAAGFCSFVNDLVYKVLVEARCELIHEMFSLKNKFPTKGKCLHSMSGSPLKAGVSDFCCITKKYSELWAPIQMFSNEGNTQSQCDDTCVKKILYSTSEILPDVNSCAVPSKPMYCPQETSEKCYEQQLVPVQLHKFTQTRENNVGLKELATFQKDLLQLTEHVNRLASVVEHLMSAQNKEQGASCSASPSVHGNDLCASGSMTPYIVLPLENLNDNPTLLSLLKCQPENTKS